MPKKQVIEIIVKEGYKGTTTTALLGLLENMNYEQIGEALDRLENKRLIRLASKIHGALYRKLM